MVGQPHTIKIPSFPLFEISCWRIWYRDEQSVDTTLRDGLIRDTAVVRTLIQDHPYEIMVENGWFIQVYTLYTANSLIKLYIVSLYLSLLSQPDQNLSYCPLLSLGQLDLQDNKLYCLFGSGTLASMAAPTDHNKEVESGQADQEEEDGDVGEDDACDFHEDNNMDRLPNDGPQEFEESLNFKCTGAVRSLCSQQTRALESLAVNIGRTSDCLKDIFLWDSGMKQTIQ